MLGSKAAEKGDKTDRCLSTTVGCCEDSIGSTTSGLAVTGGGMGTEIEGGGGGETITLRRIRFLLNSHEDGCGKVKLS